MTSSRRRGDRERWRQVAAARQGRTLARSRARREASRARQQTGREHSRQLREIALVDLIDRLLDGGVVIHGDITLAVADVDLLYVGLRALVASVETIEGKMGVSLSARGPSLDADAL